MTAPLQPAAYGQAGGKRHGVTVKKLKRALKKAGIKTSGRKSTLTKRAKKAHLKLRGGQAPADSEAEEAKEEAKEAMKDAKSAESDLAEATEMGGRRSRRGRRSGRKSRRGFKLF